MAYLQEVKDKVAEGKLEVLDSYKTFMEDIVIPELVLQSNTSCAIVDKATVVEDGIHVDNFITWLKKEGFTVTTSQDDTLINISY